LKLGDRYLDLILFRAAGSLSPPDLIAKVLPARADTLVKAAARLYPRDNQAAGRDLFYHAGLDALLRQTEPLSAPQLRLKLQLQRQLGLLAPALQTALQLQAVLPLDYDARYNLAELYYLTGDRASALREARAVRDARPSNDKAQALLEKIEKGVRPPDRK
jgi:hypothetical protein